MSALHLIVPAAGSGRRLGRPEPKALVPICGRPLIAWTLHSLRPIGFSRTVIAAPPDRISDFQALLAGVGCVVAGGDTRAASVRAAFFALRADRDDVVCVHDAARPFVSAAEASVVAERARERGAATAAIPIVDTVKEVRGDRIVRTLDRANLYAAGTPQAFRVGVLADALASGKEATDEAALCEMLGIDVSIVPVSRLGFKVTTPEDLDLAEGFLASRR